jgi:hypothetical protein
MPDLPVDGRIPHRHNLSLAANAESWLKAIDSNASRDALVILYTHHVPSEDCDGSLT